MGARQLLCQEHYIPASLILSLIRISVLFVCVNNTYGMSTPITKVMKDTDISKRALPFGMPSRTVDGNHILEVYDAVKEARQYVLENGPMLVVENTYRISGHSKSDGNLYRSKEAVSYTHLDVYKRQQEDTGPGADSFGKTEPDITHTEENAEGPIFK